MSPVCLIGGYIECTEILKYIFSYVQRETEINMYNLYLYVCVCVCMYVCVSDLSRGGQRGPQQDPSGLVEREPT